MAVAKSTALGVCVWLGAGALLFAAAPDKGGRGPGKEGDVKHRDGEADGKDDGGKDLPQPRPELEPAQVVRAVMEALQKNDDADRGIATAFNFASPGNKSVTGPLERFIPMVKNPVYSPLLNYKKAQYGPVHVVEGQAMQVVTLVDAADDVAVYAFQLSKQAEGEFKGCWMTDGVIRLEPEEAEEAEGQPVTRPPSSNGNGRYKA